MVRFSISPDLDAACVVSGESLAGEVFRVERNQSGGATLTPIARVFAWRPAYEENIRPHWRVDCFVRNHPLAPEPKSLGEAFAKALLREAICTEPLWVSWHRSEEIKGKAFGDIFD